MNGNGDYIERELAKKTFINGKHTVGWLIERGAKTVGDSFAMILDEVPAADVRPVVRGKWIWIGDCSNEGLYCSKCRNKIHEVRKPKKKLSNFCPNCGADMREES